MSDAFSKIYDLLSGTLVVLQELKQHLVNERQCIVSLDVAGVNQRRESIDSLLGAARDLNSQLEKEITSLCADNDVAEVSLSGLLEKIPAKTSDILLKKRDQILELFRETSDILTVNRNLLEDSLAFTDQSLQLFTRMIKASSGTYGQEGRYMDNKSQPRIFCKEA